MWRKRFCTTGINLLKTGTHWKIKKHLHTGSFYWRTRRYFLIVGKVGEKRKKVDAKVLNTEEETSND